MLKFRFWTPRLASRLSRSTSSSGPPDDPNDVGKKKTIANIPHHAQYSKPVTGFIDPTELARRKEQRQNTAFVTCPIYYASGKPHIGHLYSSVIGDFYHRYFKILQKDSRLSLGTDEHGIKIIRNYQQNTFKYDSIEDFVNEISSAYRNDFEQIGISVSKSDGARFIRTTDPVHHKTAQLFWNRIKDDITKDVYGGWYSYNDETYVAEHDQVIDENGKRFAKDSKHQLEYVEEESYMFDFHKYLDNVEDYINKAVDPVWHKQLHEHIDFFRQNRNNARLSITRPYTKLPWGVMVPNDPAHVMYVWFEALINYLTVAHYQTNEAGEFSASRHWPPTVQILGKDIIKFHCIYLPAMLAAADLPMPESVLIHGHWTMNGEKMGKSKANFATLEDMARVVNGQQDGIRWFLLNHVSKEDVDYSEDMLRIQSDSFLGNKIGTLIHWTTHESQNPTQMYPQLHLEHIPFDQNGENKLIQSVIDLPEKFEIAVSNGQLNKANQAVVDCIAEIQKFFSSHNCGDTNWSDLEQRHQSETYLHMVYESIRVCAILLQPSVPDSAHKILNRLGIPLESRFFEDAQNSFSKLDGIDFDRTGRRLGPEQGLIFKTSKYVIKHDQKAQALQKREDIIIEKKFQTPTIRADDNPSKRKKKKMMKKHRKRFNEKIESYSDKSVPYQD